MLLLNIFTSTSTDTDTWNTTECAFKINFVLGFFKAVKLKNYFRVDNALTIEIGTCITYFTDSDTIKNCWYWLDTDTDTRNQYSPTGHYNEVVLLKRWLPSEVAVDRNALIICMGDV